MNERRVRVAGHFGELLQGRLGPDGPVALITLPCPALGVTATVASAPELTLRHDGPETMDEARLGAFLAALGLGAGRRVTLSADAPPGGGAGVSTAALVALARAAGAEGARIAGACLAVEGAVDPLMMEEPGAWLWASREARAIRPVAPPPPMEIVGGFLGAPERTAPEDDDFPDIADLAGRWDAVAGDLSALAAIASESAARTTALRGPAGDPTEALVAETGALGWTRAHTGSARALIFPPGGAPEGLEARLASQGYSRPLRFRAP